MIMPLSKCDHMAAITEGVRQGIVALGTSDGRYDIPHELLFDAVRQGTQEAIWKLATNATGMPCHDFYASIQDGVEPAMDRLREAAMSNATD
jgi:hypothetical protein